MKTATRFAEYFSELTELRAKEDTQAIERYRLHHTNELVNWDTLEEALTQMVDILAVHRMEIKTEMNVKLHATIKTLVDNKVLTQDIADQVLDTYRQIDDQLEELENE